MPVYDTYSRRLREASGGEPDVYRYDTIPLKLRNQIHHIMAAAIGGSFWDLTGYAMSEPPHNNAGWRQILEVLRREKGVIHLSGDEFTSPCDQCLGYLISEPDTENVLDLIDVAFRYIDLGARRIEPYRLKQYDITQIASDAIEELNARFHEAGLGYQFESGRIIRVDSQLIHAEVVKPALGLLSDERFAGAEQEFRAAHEHYRKGEYKDAVIDANNAFESTLKAICDIKSWAYEKGARAADLLKVTRANGLLPDYLDTSFDQLAATLKSGLPAVRNSAGGHGQGSTPLETPGYVAAYALHLAAANIVLLVEATNAPS